MKQAIDSAVSATLQLRGIDGIDLILNARPQLPIVAKAFLRVGKREWPIRDIRDGSDYVFATYPKWISISTGCNAIRPHDLTAGAADIILRPDPENAATMLDISKIWGEEIIIPNVPIGGKCITP